MTDTQIGRALGNRNSSTIAQITRGKKKGDNLRGALHDLVNNRAPKVPERRTRADGTVAAVRVSENARNRKGTVSVNAITAQLDRAVQLKRGVNARLDWRSMSLQHYHVVNGAYHVELWGGGGRFQDPRPLKRSWLSHVARERKKGTPDRQIVETWALSQAKRRFRGTTDFTGTPIELQSASGLERFTIQTGPEPTKWATDRAKPGTWRGRNKANSTPKGRRE